MSLDQLADLLQIKTTKYIPTKPFPKQAAFLMLDDLEVLTGGALGGGKSESALMAGLQYVDQPGYAALILRRTLADLKQDGALLDRMHDWMAPWIQQKIVKYEADAHRFRFPTFSKDGRKRLKDATVTFGYIGHNSNARIRYQGIEVQAVIFDELTQHHKIDYEYLFTRLRKCLCPIHLKRDKEGNPIYHSGCEECDRAKAIPIRMRGTCNPDGIGFRWVKERWKISPTLTEEEERITGQKAKWVGKHPVRVFIPASFYDNPYINTKEYEQQLREQLSSDMYEAYVNGSWGVVAHAKFKSKWKRYYSQTGALIYLGPNLNSQKGILDIRKDFQKVFQTLDTAATSVEGPGDIDINPGKVKNPSWTVMCTWGLTKCYNLLLLHMLRIREEIPEVIKEMKSEYLHWKPVEIIVEENGLGKGVKQYADRMGMRVKGISRTTDKVEDATTAIIKMEEGRFWFPQDNLTWMTEVNDELFTWDGNKDATDDIVDNFSMAANNVDWKSAPEALEYAGHDDAVYESHDAPGIISVSDPYRYGHLFRDAFPRM